jgi:hypothetical protein
MNSGGASARGGPVRGGSARDTFPGIKLLLSVHSWTMHPSNCFLVDLFFTKVFLSISLSVTVTDDCELQYSAITVSAADI